MTPSTRAVGSTVVLIGTGGTISARLDADGVATVAGELPDAVESIARTATVPLRVVDLFALDSSALTLAHLDRIDSEVGRAIADPSVVGVVVSHGTDTMEETALLVDLHHGGAAPVVFTGAQRTADHPRADGPANLALAIATASDPIRAGRVWIAFGGRVLPAAGTTKIDTAELVGFGPDRPGNGMIDDSTPRPALPPEPVGDVVVDVVTLSVGGGDRALRAAVAADVDGIVLVGLGAGNAHPGVVPVVAEATARGIPVALTSRTPFGPITATYGGGGGGHDLVHAGAVPTGYLRASQARIALAATIAAHRAAGTPERVRDVFAGICAGSGRSGPPPDRSHR